MHHLREKEQGSGGEVDQWRTKAAAGAEVDAEVIAYHRNLFTALLTA
jgi:hypothetical protein